VTPGASARPRRPPPRRRRPPTAARRTDVLLYGASGYTGGLIAREAKARDLPLVLAGRDAARLGALGRELGRPIRVAPLDDPRALDAALEGVSVVVNAAGPFSATARPLVEACLAAGVHYLDVSGEVDALEAVARHDDDARDAGVMLMPGVGFDVVPSDCLAARVKRRLPEAHRLLVGVAGLELASRGSVRTILQQVGRGVRIRRAAELASVPEGVLEATFDFGRGPRAATCVSWGDVVTAFHTTGIPNIEVYFEATAAVRAFQLLGQSTVFPPAAFLSQLWLRGWTELQREGPTPAERAARHAVIVARAEAPDGRVVVSRARLPEVYTFTSIAAAVVAARVRGGEFQAGFQTPARIFGEDFVGTFDDVIVEDLRGPEATPDPRERRKPRAPRGASR
jgi:short subunit dehydrogenase-like uncharacterized protein